MSWYSPLPRPCGGCVVWVGNLPDLTSHQELSGVLQDEGWSVKSVHLFKNGVGRLVFRRKTDAQSALSHPGIRLKGQLLVLDPWIPGYKKEQTDCVQVAQELVTPSPVRQQEAELQDALLEVSLSEAKDQVNQLRMMVEDLQVRLAAAVASEADHRKRAAEERTHLDSQLHQAQQQLSETKATLVTQVEQGKAQAHKAEEQLSTVQALFAAEQDKGAQLQKQLDVALEQDHRRRLFHEKVEGAVIGQRLQLKSQQAHRIIEEELETEAGPKRWSRKDRLGLLQQEGANLDEVSTSASSADGSPGKASSAISEKDKALEELQELKEELRRRDQSEEELRQFIEDLRQELLRQCTDPISLQPMVDPVLAADLHTYDRQSIEEWHKRKPSSPMTQAPMEITTLRANRNARWVLETYHKFWGEAGSEPGLISDSKAKEAVPVLVEKELSLAIFHQEEDLALELLAKPIDNWHLNAAVRYQGEPRSLLFLALIRHCPRAARALCCRADFRRAASYAAGVLPIHLATALGYSEVCQAILADHGEGILHLPTRRPFTLVAETGETIKIPELSSSYDLARRLKRDEILAIFRSVTVSKDQ